MRLAVIGTGNMGKALLGGFVKGGVINPSDAWCFDVYTEACRKCAEDLGVNAASSAIEAVTDADYVLMAVKPVHFDDALKSIKDSLKPGAIVLSIAAAVTCARIGGILGEGRKFVRIMPNTPAQVGLGVAAVCPVGLSDEESDFVLKLLNTCGETIRADALKIAAATVAGSGKLALETGTHPAVLKDMVCSPGGTTIAGVMALEENGLRNAVIKSVTAAYDKTQEMKGNK